MTLLITSSEDDTNILSGSASVYSSLAPHTPTSIDCVVYATLTVSMIRMQRAYTLSPMEAKLAPIAYDSLHSATGTEMR